MDPELNADDIYKSITRSQQEEPDSGILVAVNHGTGRQGLIPLWVGEGHLPTPEFICRAAYEALRRGETFYTYQRGIPELRATLAAYHTRLYGKEFSDENFFVTGGGMQAMQTIFQLLTREGDEIVLPTPAWPNYPGPMRMKGAVPVEVPMTFVDGKWTLDLDRLFDAVTDRTVALCLNSPSNPIGWVASLEELIAIRDFARDRGLWIVADEVYGRFYYGDDGDLAPSFLTICEPEERIIHANTFSKNWAMTGWRIGWIYAPVAVGDAIERIIQYNTSGTAAFMQSAAVTAVKEGEDFVHEQVARARENRDMVCEMLSQFLRTRFEVPSGAFYQFFGLEGMKDSTETCLRLIDEAGIGLAPGGTFGKGGEEFLRICYLRDRDQLRDAMNRLGNWLDNNDI